MPLPPRPARPGASPRPPSRRSPACPALARGSRPIPVAAALGAVLGLLVGCNLDNPGQSPPPATIHFPIALALSETQAGTPLLLVANQNLDAQYNSGTLQTWSAAVLNDLLDDCAASPRPSDCPRTVQGTTQGLLVDEVRIPTFAQELVAGPDGRRFYLSVEGRNGDLVHVDFDPASGLLSCGQPQGGRCAGEHIRVDPGLEDARDLDFDGDLVALAVGGQEAIGLGAGEGAFVLAGHRSGRVSLALDGATGVAGLPSEPADRPLLVDFLDERPAVAVVEITFDPESGLFWLSSGRDPQATVARVGVAYDPDGDEAPSLFDAGPLIIDGVTDGTDIRDVAFPTGPDEVVLLSRTPEAVLFATRNENDPRELTVETVVPVCGGPGELAVATIAGRIELLVSCFDARRVDVVDLDTRTLITSIREAGGAFDLAVDEARNRLYITDFDNSTIRVASLAPLAECLTAGEDGVECSPVLLGSLGLPTRSDEL